MLTFIVLIAQLVLKSQGQQSANFINNLLLWWKDSWKRLGWHFPFLNLWPLLPAGVSLNPIIVYCANQEEMDLWFGLLKENIEANGGTAIALENYELRVKVSSATQTLPDNLYIIWSFNETASYD